MTHPGAIQKRWLAAWLALFPVMMSMCVHEEGGRGQQEDGRGRLASKLQAGTVHDVLIRHGDLFDGSGRPPFPADLAIDGETVTAVGDLEREGGRLEIDARGLAVAPGFINMLSWSTESLLVDGRSMSEILQGVTLEVFGEGRSMGPLNRNMVAELLARQGDLHYKIKWRSLGEYLQRLADGGVSPNVASFVGATTIRENVLGHLKRAPTAAEMEEMRHLVRQAMSQGAMGMGSALIYEPGLNADTEELIALAKAAGESGGLYISHLRSEGDGLLDGLDEIIRVGREAGVPVEIYHLKAAGRDNWDHLEAAISRIEAARREGLTVTADTYPYTAASTGLDAAMPPWVQEGGLAPWVRRLGDPRIRARLEAEMKSRSAGWENLYQLAGSAENLLLLEFHTDALKPFTGLTLAEVARRWQVTPEVAAMDLVVKDRSRVGVAYFLMSEENVRRKIQLPWMSFGSDAASAAAEGVFLRSSPHPRAYGCFARLLGRYVRDEHLLSLAEAIRRMTSLPAANLKLSDRGLLKPGFKADVVVFDPLTVQDRSTYTNPHRYAAGMRHVFVNGTPVIRDGVHTGALPGQVVRGPGYQANAEVP